MVTEVPEMTQLLCLCMCLSNVYTEAFKVASELLIDCTIDVEIILYIISNHSDHSYIWLCLYVYLQGTLNEINKINAPLT